MSKQKAVARIYIVYSRLAERNLSTNIISWRNSCYSNLNYAESSRLRHEFDLLL